MVGGIRQQCIMAVPWPWGVGHTGQDGKEQSRGTSPLGNISPMTRLVVTPIAALSNQNRVATNPGSVSGLVIAEIMTTRLQLYRLNLLFLFLNNVPARQTTRQLFCNWTLLKSKNGYVKVYIDALVLHCGCCIIEREPGFMWVSHLHRADRKLLI